MAHNPHAPQGPGPEGQHDPAGSTQMFRAFVEEGAPQQQQRATASSGPRTGMIVGVALAVVIVVAAVAWLALA